MALSRKHKVYAGMVSLGLMALVTDRVFLGYSGGPQAAPADDIVLVRAAPKTQAGPSAKSSPARARENSLAGRLEAIAAAHNPQSAPSRDVFTLPKPWREAMQPAKPEEPPVPPTERLTTKYRLMAVMVNGKGGQAIIDGKCLQVGQQRDGLKLISVRQDSAVVEVSGRRFRLKLEAPTWTPSTQPSPE